MTKPHKRKDQTQGQSRLSRQHASSWIELLHNLWISYLCRSQCLLTWLRDEKYSNSGCISTIWLPSHHDDLNISHLECIACHLHNTQSYPPLNDERGRDNGAQHTQNTSVEPPTVEDHSIYFQETGLRIPLQLWGVFSYLPTSKPIYEDMTDSEKVYLLNNSRWNPRDKELSSN